MSVLMTFQIETHTFISTLLKLFLLAGTLQLPSQHVMLWRLEVHQDILEQKLSNLSAGAGAENTELTLTVLIN